MVAANDGAQRPSARHRVLVVASRQPRHRLARRRHPGDVESRGSQRVVPARRGDLRGGAMIYTWGYRGRTLTELRELRERLGAVIVDVRLVPFQRNGAFNR